MVEFIDKVHEAVKQKIEASNSNYKIAADKHMKQLTFKVGDLVWALLTKERQPNSL